MSFDLPIDTTAHDDDNRSSNNNAEVETPLQTAVAHAPLFREDDDDDTTGIHNNTTAEMLVDEIVDTVARGGYSVSAPVNGEAGVVDEEEEAAAYDEPTHLADVVLAAARRTYDVAPETEPAAKRVKLENDEADAVQIENAGLEETSSSPKYQEESRAFLPSPSAAPTAAATAAEPRKKRKEFTASEKLQILSELDHPNPPTIKELLAKYSLSKSSFHRWRQEGFKERLIAMASGEKAEAAQSLADVSSSTSSLHNPHAPSLLYKGHKKRDMYDGLLPLKRAIQNFVSYNATLPEEEQYAIRSPFLQVKSRELRNQLIQEALQREREIDEWKKLHPHPRYPNELSYQQQQEEEPLPLLTPNEMKALKEFKGSKSWACQIAGQLGLLQYPWSEASEQNTQRYMDEASSATAGPLFGTAETKRPKKARAEFTAADKVRILAEIEEETKRRKADGRPVWSVEEICERYGTSKSSLHRWRQQRRSGQLNMALGDGNREIKRICRDKLLHVKRALVQFVEERGGEGVGYAMLQERALAVRDELLRGFEVMNGLTSGDVVPAGVETAAVANVDVDEGPNVNAAVEGDAATLEESVAANHTEESTAEQPPTEVNSPVEITEEEYHHLSSFKASISWLREVAKKYNFVMDSTDENNGRGSGVLYANYYHQHHGEDGQNDAVVVEGVIGEEQVEEILDGQGDVNEMVVESGEVQL